jgi:hypothetical protein
MLHPAFSPKRPEELVFILANSAGVAGNCYFAHNYKDSLLAAFTSPQNHSRLQNLRRYHNVSGPFHMSFISKVLLILA